MLPNCILPGRCADGSRFFFLFFFAKIHIKIVLIMFIDLFKIVLKLLREIFKVTNALWFSVTFWQVHQTWEKKIRKLWKSSPDSWSKNRRFIIWFQIARRKLLAYDFYIVNNSKSEFKLERKRIPRIFGRNGDNKRLCKKNQKSEVPRPPPTKKASS